MINTSINTLDIQCANNISKVRGFTLTEMLVVIMILSLLLMITQIHIFSMLRRNNFKSQVQLLISTMQSAATSASQSDRRYEFIVDISEQSFLLREITSLDLSEVLEEEIIFNEKLSKNCRVIYVEFDDGDFTYDGRAKFRAGHSGWAFGGKIVLIDENGQPYSIVVNRLNRIITLKEGDYKLLTPVPKDAVRI